MRWGWSWHVGIIAMRGGVPLGMRLWLRLRRIVALDVDPPDASQFRWECNRDLQTGTST